MERLPFDGILRMVSGVYMIAVLFSIGRKRGIGRTKSSVWSYQLFVVVARLDAVNTLLLLVCLVLDIVERMSVKAGNPYRFRHNTCDAFLMIQQWLFIRWSSSDGNDRIFFVEETIIHAMEPCLHQTRPWRFHMQDRRSLLT